MHNPDIITKLIYCCITTHGIYRDCSTISRMYHIHPMPNSVRSVSDTLDELGVVNYVYYLNPDQLTSIVYPAIAPTTSSFVLITAVSNGNVTVIGEGDKEITVSLEDFAKIWNGYILTVDPSNEQNTNKSASYYLGQLMWHLNKKAIFYLCASLIVLICSTSRLDGFLNVLFLASGLAGIAISAAVYIKENKINNPLAGLCNIKGRDRCQEVIGSKGSKILGHISIGDLSLTYFVTITFITILPNYSIGAVSLYPLTSITFVIYSVIWILVNKKACPLCITIDLLLIVQAILVTSSLAEIEFTRLTLTYAVAFFIVYLALIKLKDLLNSERELKSLKTVKEALISDTNIFWGLMRHQQCAIQKMPEHTIWNSKDSSKPTILIVINPHCPFCHRLHKKLWRLSDYNIELIFLTKENDRKAELAAAYILEQFHNGNLSWEKANVFIEDYYKESTSPAFWHIEDKSYDILMQHRAFCIENDILGTPMVLIDGRRIPEQYILPDLEYIL